MSLRDEIDAADPSRQDIALAKLKEYLRTENIDLADLGRVEKIRLSDYQSITKDDEGEAHVHDLKATSVVLSPSWESGPEWPVVDQAKPVSIKVPKRSTTAGPNLGGKWKTAAFVPDTQIGFRQTSVGTLDPFHDPRALDVTLQILEAERPDHTVLLGDVLDLAPMGKYRFESFFANTVQPAVEFAFQFVATIAAISRVTEYMSGNHDVRLQNYVTDNALQAFGLRRANAAPEEWPVLSIQYLLRLDELGVRYVGSYPAGATYLADNLAAIHGAKIGNKNRTAAQLVVEDEGVCVVYGHTHKKAYAAKTRNTRGAPQFNWAYSPGCLCRIDGAVPGTKSGVDALGYPIRAWQDWQQGLGLIRYHVDGKRIPMVEDVFIEEGQAMHDGQEFTSDLKVDGT